MQHLDHEEDVSKHIFTSHFIYLLLNKPNSEVPSVLEFLQRRKLEAKKALNSSDKTKLKVRKLQHQSSHNLKPSYALSSTVSCQTKKIRKPDISKASTAGGKNFTSKTLHVKGMIDCEGIRFD
ncbi:hypothetical protein Tco_0322140 [Tanacetum coccineum]